MDPDLGRKVKLFFLSLKKFQPDRFFFIFNFFENHGLRRCFANGEEWSAIVTMGMAREYEKKVEKRIINVKGRGRKKKTREY